MTFVVKITPILAAFVCGLAGCLTPSSIGVLFDVELAVRGIRADGSTWNAASSEISKGEPSPREFDPYGRTIYRNREFEASFAVSKRSIGMLLTNLTSTSICFRFDQGRLSSNFEPVPKALRNWPAFREGEYSRMTNADWTRRLEAGPQPMEKECLGAGATKEVFSIDNRIAAFPSGMMFNIAHPKDAPKLNPDGVGNWAILHLPIEVGNRREDVEFTMTAKQSRARAMYW